MSAVADTSGERQAKRLQDNRENFIVGCGEGNGDAVLARRSRDYLAG